MSSSYHILRVGMAITFLWVGILIFKDPTFWSGFMPPFMIDLFDNLIPLTILTGVLDVLIGVGLLFDVLTFWFALIGFAHMLGILLLTGIDVTTVRDIGLAAGSFALAVEGAPERIRKYFRHS